MCSVRSLTVQPGQDSTGVSGGASATAAAKAGPSARSAPIQKSLLPCSLLIAILPGVPGDQWVPRLLLSLR